MGTWSICLIFKIFYFYPTFGPYSGLETLKNGTPENHVFHGFHTLRIDDFAVICLVHGLNRGIVLSYGSEFGPLFEKLLSFSKN